MNDFERGVMINFGISLFLAFAGAIVIVAICLK